MTETTKEERDDARASWDEHPGSERGDVWKRLINDADRLAQTEQGRVPETVLEIMEELHKARLGPSPAIGPSFYYGAYNLPFDTEVACQHVADAYVGNKLHRYMQAWCVAMTPSQVQEAKERVYFDAAPQPHDGGSDRERS